MKMIDPVALAEAARNVLDRFGELTVCAKVRGRLVMHATRYTG